MINTREFEEVLKKELETLEAELRRIGRINPKNPADWEARPEEMDVLPSDPNEVADSIEAFEENTAALKQLEIRYNEVKEALERIKGGVYGRCEIGGEEIELERLRANPAAKTCVAHMK